jgi:hypothetical protein
MPHVGRKSFAMSQDSNPASPGYPSQVVAQSQPRDPIGGIPFTSHAQNPAIGGIATTFGTQVVTVPHAVVARVDGAQNRR